MNQPQNSHRPYTQPQNRPMPIAARKSKLSVFDLFTIGPPLVALLAFVIVTLGFFALQTFDVIAGQTIIEYMSNSTYGWFVSFGTTGLVVTLVGTALYGIREGWSWKVTLPIYAISLIPGLIDVYFDGLAADVIRYGNIVLISSLPLAEQTPHILFRVLIAGLSFVGEPLAATSVIVFPVLKELFLGVLGGRNDN